MGNANKTRRILIADTSQVVIDNIKNALSRDPLYELKVTSDGNECLELIYEFSPHLVIVELTLPHLHAIDILKKVKSKPEVSLTGFIVSTWKALIQDYQAAIENGADYYLLKPFSQATLLRLVDSFFEGNLRPASFPINNFVNNLEQEFYNSPFLLNQSYLKIWGSRGSIPVAGPEYIVYGGNTPCMEITNGESLIIIDAGTGIRPLGQQILKSKFKEIHLFIGHTHWDHILGFPFFAPVYSREYDIHIYAAKGFGKNVQELFKGMLDHDYFPVKLDEMQAKFIFHDLADNLPVEIGNIKIHYAYASHPGATLCFKIESKNKIIGYATDNEVLVGYHGHPKKIDYNHPLLFPYRDLITFFSNCDSIIHEAQYTPYDYGFKVGWGHSSISNAAVFIKHCGVRDWYVTHHDPEDTDQIIRKKLQMHQAILADCSHSCFVDMIYDGYVIPL
jgi:phosphoribosyl 1,2-cyclic phosphodiesterase/DNA-binding NarL/FixJ family response regulator